MYYLEKLVLAYVIRKDGGADGSGGKLLLIFTANIHDRIFARISNKNWKTLWKKLVYFKKSVLSFCQSVQYIMYRVDKQQKKKRALAAQIVLYAFALLTCCVEICEF